MSKRTAVLALFVLSGATGLCYEGHAAATTLTVFFSGLAAGGWFFGRRAARLRNGLRAYGWLEIGVAATALLYLTLRGMYFLVYAPVYEAFGERLPLLLGAKFLLAFLLLFPAAFLMGATLPVLGQ